MEKSLQKSILISLFSCHFKILILWIIVSFHQLSNNKLVQRAASAELIKYSKESKKFQIFFTDSERRTSFPLFDKLTCFHGECNYDATLIVPRFHLDYSLQ